MLENNLSGNEMVSIHELMQIIALDGDLKFEAICDLISRLGANKALKEKP